jgi:IclR family pca regulon transcriptional regulator
MPAKPASARQTTRRETMGGLAKGLSVIRAFSSERPVMTLSEIAAATGMPAATARRCLHTLEDLEYVRKIGRSFLLRPKVLQLGAAYLESMNIESLTSTHLEEVARRTGDSAALAVFDNPDIVYIARASVRTVIRMEAHVGTRFPAYPTSMGRILLAGLDDARLDRYLKETRLLPLTDKTETDPAKLRKIILEVRRAGYSAVEDELAYGVVAVAIPVVDRSGRVIAALNSASHSKRMSKARIVRERLKMLREVAALLSAELIRVPGLSLGDET